MEKTQEQINIDAFNKGQDKQKTGKRYVSGKGVIDNPVTSPTPVAPDPTLKDRYVKQRENINTNPVYNVDKPNEETIRNEYRNRNMGYINAIKSQFDKYIDEDIQAKQALESKTYINNLASGMSGSVSGASKEYKASETGNKKIRETKAQRDLMIANVEKEADLRASQEFDQQRKEYLASAKDKELADQALSGNIRKTAEAEISDIAQGKAYSELSPKLKELYKKELNLDDEQLQALFISKTPKAKEVKLADGSIAYYQQDIDENGEVTMKEVGRMKGSGGKEIKGSRITDNGVQILYSDGTYEFKGNAGTEETPIAKPSKPIAGTPKTFIQDDIAKGREVLSRSGSNGYASPSIYYAVYKKWIEEGGTEKKFLELYPPNQFANPAEADLYPTMLQPSTNVMKKETKETVVSPTSPTPTTSTSRPY